MSVTPETSTLKESTVLIRDAGKDDWAFLVASWLQNYRRESYFAARITDVVFYAKHHKVIESIVARSKTLVSCLASDPSEILGVLVCEASPPTLHWVYVKKSYRRWGIASRLIQHSGLPIDLAGVRISHPTKMWFTTKQHGPGLEDKFPRAIHDPYAGLIRSEQ